MYHLLAAACQLDILSRSFSPRESRYIIIEVSGPMSTQHGQSIPGLPLPARCEVPRLAVAAALKSNIGRAATRVRSTTGGGGASSVSASKAVPSATAAISGSRSSSGSG